MEISDGSAVLVIDMQNDYCSDNGRMAKEGWDVSRNQAVAHRLPKFLSRCRDANALIIWIKQQTDSRFTSAAHRRRSRGLGREGTNVIALSDSWGSELYPPLVAEGGDVIISKQRYSAFYGTMLEALLRANNREDLIVCGTAGNVCVDSTVRDAYMRGFNIFLPTDLVGGTRFELVDSAITNLGIYFCGIVDSESIDG